MVDQPDPSDILRAVQTSGYLLEQEVATTLETLGLIVQTNRAYTDLEEDKSREIDVWGVWRVLHDEANKISVFVELICECKNSQAPFVFLTRPKRPQDNAVEPGEFSFPRTHYGVPVPDRPGSTQMVPAFEHLRLATVHYRYRESSRAVQFAKVLRDKGNWVANHAGLYDAILYPLVKALVALREETTERKRTSSWRYLYLRFPILVTTGRLFVLNTSDPASLPTSVDRVSFTRHFKSKRIDGHFSVDFVTQAGLPALWTEAINPFVEHVVDMVKTDTNLFK